MHTGMYRSRKEVCPAPDGSGPQGAGEKGVLPPVRFYSRRLFPHSVLTGKNGRVSAASPGYPARLQAAAGLE